MYFSHKIKSDLSESRINLKIIILFIPVAFLTYLFHEVGHWLAGELLGNDMVLSLNNAAPQSGYYIKEVHNLYVTMGGPAFTILQAVIFLLVIEITKSIYAYPFVIFAAFSRFFSDVFGGLSLQDEGRISEILHTGAYSASLAVILVLFLIVWRSSYLLKLNLKAIGYFTVLCTLGSLLVIGENKLIA